jgi:hypothetical protein
LAAFYNLDKIVKSRFKNWIPAPRLRGDRLSGYDVHDIYLIFIALLSFPRRREPRKWENQTFYETIKILSKIFNRWASGTNFALIISHADKTEK